MRVCMFVYNPLSHDARVFREASSLATEGHTVEIVGFQAGDLETVEERGGFTIRRIERRSLRLWLRRLWRRLGFQTRPAGPGGLLHRWQKLIDWWWQGYRLVREQPPADVYHAHDLNTLPLATAAARHAKGKLVYDSHELFPDRQVIRPAEKPVWRFLERQLIGRADRVITVSERYADELVARYGIERPLVLLNCPVLNGRLPSNGSAELLRRTAGLDNDLPIVVFQGLITRERGLEQLIGAAKRLPEVAVVMLGNGTYAEELQRLIDEEGVGDRVKLPGAVPEDELLANTAGGTVGVSPIEGTSISQAYTVQNKIFEYIGAGLPVLATRLPGTAPIIEEYGFGLFFEPGDSDSLAGAIERVLGDRELYEELRAKAVEASKIFNWEQESRKLVSLYTSLGEAVGA